jgi:hypothetical protein
MISRLRFPRLNHVRGCTLNRQWLVTELLVLRNWFRFRGIADMAGPVAGVANDPTCDIGGYQLNSLDAGFCLYRKWLTHGQMVCIANAGNFRFLSASSKVTR